MLKPYMSPMVVPASNVSFPCSNTWGMDGSKGQTLPNFSPVSAVKGVFHPNLNVFSVVVDIWVHYLQSVKRTNLTLALFIQHQGKHLGWMICASDPHLLSTTADSRHLVLTSRAHLLPHRYLVQVDALEYPPESPASNTGGHLCPVGLGSYLPASSTYKCTMHLADLASIMQFLYFFS